MRVLSKSLFFLFAACGASSPSALSVAPVHALSIPTGVCGDGIRNEGEVCDDGSRRCRPNVGFCFQCVRCAGRVLVRNRPGVPVENDPAAILPTLPGQDFCSAQYGNGDTAEATYDERGRPLVRQRLGQHRSRGNFAYEADERLQQFDSDGDGHLDIVLRDRIDEAGRSFESEVFAGPAQISLGLTRREFGEHGPLRSAQEQNGVPGNSREFSYDELGQLTRAVSSNGERFEYLYEGGRRVETQYASRYEAMSRIASFEYDARGLLTVAHHAEPGQETRWSYDEMGAVVSQEDTVLPSTSYRYTYEGPRVVAFEQIHRAEDGAERTERHRYQVEGTLVLETVDVEGSVPASAHSRLSLGHSENRYETGCLARFEEFLPE